MSEKLPYYMVYPMPLAYDDERIERRDYEYMKSMYPDVAKRVLPYVEEECDRMECPCSMMYDEYPDQLQLRMMCSRIYEKVRRQERIFLDDGYEEIEMQSENHPDRQPGRERSKRERMPQRYPQRTDWLRNLIEVMTYQELYKRRQDDRRARRRFY